MQARIMKKPKPRRGRPPLAPGTRRDRQLNILMRAEEREHLIDMANKNSRSVSEEVMRRIRTSIAQEALWNDLAELRLARVQAAKRVLLDAGWIEAEDPKYGGEVLLPPGSAPPGPFIVPGEELPSIVASPSVERTLRGVFEVWNIPVPERASLRKALLEALIKIVPKKGEKEETDAPRTDQPTAPQTKVKKDTR
jgi:hypothetical protein